MYREAQHSTAQPPIHRQPTIPHRASHPARQVWVLDARPTAVHVPDAATAEVQHVLETVAALPLPFPSRQALYAQLAERGFSPGGPPAGAVLGISIWGWSLRKQQVWAAAQGGTCWWGRPVCCNACRRLNARPPATRHTPATPPRPAALQQWLGGNLTQESAGRYVWAFNVAGAQALFADYCKQDYAALLRWVAASLEVAGLRV